MKTPDSRGDARSDGAEWRLLRPDSSAIDPEARSVLIVASFTANPVEAGLGVSLVRSGWRPPTIRFADYNQLFQVCLQPDAHQADTADEIVFIWRIEDVFERDFLAWSNGIEGSLDRLLDGVASLGSSIAALTTLVPGNVIVSDVPAPTGFGLDHNDPAMLTELITLQTALNSTFDRALADAPVERIRLAALQIAEGTNNAFDRRNWLMYRQPFSDRFAHSLGIAVADLIAARTRVPPKVLALDCDDTLWGGIAANDGIGSLNCGDAFPGFAYRSFQIAVQRLRHQGVLLAIISKNDPETVHQAFAEIDGMILEPDDIAGWRVSWNPKPPELASLADEFNVGVDSFVFVDDSTYETGSMRSQLPDVMVLQVPEDIEALPDLISESGLFRLLNVTTDDRERTGRIIAESDRVASAKTLSHEEFLASLDLHVHLVEVDSSEIGRVTQLINKTNQFNLTTVRRDEGSVRSIIDDDDSVVYATSVYDRFGEYGIVGVVVATVASGGWTLDTVLMSCRVLGRGVESAMLASAVQALRKIMPGDVTGTYVPTDRNAIVADLLGKHGFDESGAGRAWVLPADRQISLPPHIVLTGP